MLSSMAAVLSLFGFCHDVFGAFIHFKVVKVLAMGLDIFIIPFDWCVMILTRCQQRLDESCSFLG